MALCASQCNDVLITFGENDRVEIGRDSRGVTFSPVGKIPTRFLLKSSVPKRMMTARVSPTRNLDLVRKFLSII